MLSSWAREWVKWGAEHCRPPQPAGKAAAGHHAKHLRDSLGLLFYGETIVVNFSTNTYYRFWVTCSETKSRLSHRKISISCRKSKEYLFSVSRDKYHLYSWRYYSPVQIILNISIIHSKVDKCKTWQLLHCLTAKDLSVAWITLAFAFPPWRIKNSLKLS